VFENSPIMIAELTCWILDIWVISGSFVAYYAYIIAK